MPAPDFSSLLGPSLLRTCPNCGGCGRPIRYPWVSCEPCDGSGMVPSAAGRDLLEVLGDGRVALGPPAAPAAGS